MSTVVLPKVRMSVSWLAHEGTMTASVKLEGLGEAYESEGVAPVTHGATAIPTIASELAMARALNDLQHQIMGRLHERIDRSTDDV